jgi:hypothetical protein
MTDVADAAVAAGRAAWARIREHGRKSFDDWITVAKALAIGRSVALQAADTNRPVGSRFNRTMGAWLRQAGLDGINNQERYRALLVLENISAISAWRDGLDETQRRRLNHPGAIWAHWQRALKGNAATGGGCPPAVGKTRTQAAETTQQRQHVVQHVTAAAEAARRGRAVYWSQDAIRRAHHAMLDSKSSDLLTLARAALEAAIRTEADLLALLPADPPGKPAPRSISAPAATAAHAQA